MKKTLSLIFGSIMLLLGIFSIDSAAQSRTGETGVKRHPYSINNRERRQQRRIRQGIRSGELTSREVYRLQRNQYQVRRLESRYRRSGKGLTWRERYNLQRRLNKSSRRIYRQKHDRQDY